MTPQTKKTSPPAQTTMPTEESGAEAADAAVVTPSVGADNDSGRDAAPPTAGPPALPGGVSSGVAVPRNLTAKLVAASLAVENVEKRGRNDQQKYDYVRADDVAAAATRVLLSYGVLCEFEVLASVSTPTKSKSGTDGLIVTVEAQLVVTDSETGEVTTLRTEGSGSDYPGDKAIYKAMTGARKYAFIHLLGIPIGDDPEVTREPVTAAQVRKPTPQLDRQRVAALKKSIHDHSLKYRDIDLILGSLGLEALRANSAKAVEERLRSLAPEQADQLETLVTREGERNGE